ncbi:MAG: hypothetical protein GY820_47145 [Gammaproteobacteria bacterium]|nr:hypothetical protein [Gammaproteobacteria bacterium]
MENEKWERGLFGGAGVGSAERVGGGGPGGIPPPCQLPPRGEGGAGEREGKGEEGGRERMIGKWGEESAGREGKKGERSMVCSNISIKMSKIIALRAD